MLLGWLLMYGLILILIGYILKEFKLIEFFTIKPSGSSMPYSPTYPETLYNQQPFTEPLNDYSKIYNSSIESYEDANPTIESISQSALRIAPYLNN